MKRLVKKLIGDGEDAGTVALLYIAATFVIILYVIIRLV